MLNNKPECSRLDFEDHRHDGQIPSLHNILVMKNPHFCRLNHHPHPRGVCMAMLELASGYLTENYGRMPIEIDGF